MLLSVDGKLSAAKSAHQIKKMALPLIEVDDPRFKRPRNVVFFPAYIMIGHPFLFQR